MGRERERGEKESGETVGPTVSGVNSFAELWVHQGGIIFLKTHFFSFSTIWIPIF